MAINKTKLPIGCHVSIAGGLWNAPANAAKLGCETFQIFSRSPHGGSVPAVTQETVEQFQEALQKHALSQFVIHAPYILNFGSGNPRIYHGSISIVRKELERGSQLGAAYVMFHPGSLKDLGEEAGMKQVCEGFQKVLAGYEGTTKLLIENTAGAGSVAGDTFEELAVMLEAVKDYPGFGGFCYDTQHAFASGYDIRTPEAVVDTFKQFDKYLGLDYLRMFQINDSKIELGGKRDRHEHIEDGLIGKAGFAALLAFLQKKKLDVPLILETEHDKVEADIEILKTLRDKAKIK
jgi:deoxyribonuclease IV